MSAPEIVRRSVKLDTRGQLVKPGERWQITARPQVSAIKIDHIEISTNPDAWLVHDIIVGNRSQFGAPLSRRARDLPISGSEFSSELGHWELEVCQVAQDLRVEIEYVGKRPEGEPFVAEASGNAIR